MKKIINKETELRDAKGTVDRNTFLKFIVNEPTKEGLTITQMRERMRIIDVIEKVGKGNIELEDADFINLKNIFDNYHFVSVHKHIIELADHLDDLIKQK